MAIDLQTAIDDEPSLPLREPNGEPAFDVWGPVKRMLEPVASLRLTVVLFALSIMLILAGTFAQVDKDIWDVIGQYFRCWFAWIPFVVFFPPSFVPEMPQNPDEVTAFGRFCIQTMQGLKSIAEKSGGIYFPGGKLIGLALAANLVAAHAVRFKAQAVGMRLLSGLGALAVGCGITWFVIAAAGNTRNFQTEPWVPYSTLWIGYQGLVGLLALGSLYLAARLWMTFTNPGDEAALKSAGGRTNRQYFVLGVLAVSMVTFLVLLFVSFSVARPSDASLRILWQLTQGGTAAAALLTGCWIVFGKRAGIVLLHSGIGLLMFYELHVAMTAVETQMNLQEGETTAYVHDIRTYELAVIDKSKAGEEFVVAIPKSKIVQDATIDFADLPFQVVVKDILPNSHLRAASVRDRNPATAGLGVEWFAESKAPGTGTDMDSKVDMTAAYVSLVDRATQKPLGTYLVSMLLSMSNETDTLRVGDKTYELALRPKRYYKPFQFRLIDVSKKDYIGTNTPRSYASTVHIEDGSRNVNEDKTIWMNNPLRFANETFYQSSYYREKDTGIEHTTLSVVANSGWMMPYVACMLVGVGMLVHFLTMLIRFLMRSDVVAPSGNASRLAERLGMKAALPAESPNALVDRKIDQYLDDAARKPTEPVPASIVATVVVLALAGSYIVSVALPPQKKDLDIDLYRFGQIPVVQDGRVKPLDSAANSALLTISGRNFVELGHGKDKQKVPAIQWLLDVIAETDIADDYEVFRVDNLEVQETLGVKKREGMRYSRNEIQKQKKEFDEQVIRAREVAKKDRRDLSTYQRKVLELSDKLSTFDNLKYAFGLHHRIRGSTQEELIQSFEMAKRFAKMIEEEGEPVLAIGPKDKDHEWRTFSGAWMDDLLNKMRDKGDPSVKAWDTILATYSDMKLDDQFRKDPKAARPRPQDFNRDVNDYLKELHEQPPVDVKLSMSQFESWFNHFDPFTHSTRLYLLAFIIGACGWLAWTPNFNRMAFWLLCLTLLVHSWGLVSRIIISGRPPVTNLYSSAVFIGVGCVFLGLVLELVYRLGIGNLVASVAGYATLLIADGLSRKGDTFTVLQAVLDTQFWLATHVTTITLGYATTYLAGALGTVYVLRGVFTPTMSPQLGRELNRMMYGALCFSIFFSFVGTVLGGLWADDSWGRFWGWDPKENGALIIVLWNALVLHARWGGMVKERGMAVLAIAGNIFVSWSWWGVNELGAGLHSYGFTEGTVIKLGLFVLANLVLIGVGMIPKRFWVSTRTFAA